MSECECLEKCIFFNDKMAKVPTMAEMMKKKYCLGNSDGCARHIVFKAKGKGNVPPDLFPNQHDTAKRIVSS